MTGLIDFSIFPAENGTAAPPINWPEGMPANAVNNSAREMMAALARWRVDTTGVLSASITGDVATLDTFQGVKPSHFGSSFAVSFATTQPNPGPMLLNIDGTGGRPWRRPRGFEFGPGDIVPLEVHLVVWSPTQGAYISIAPTFDTPGKIALFASAAAIPPGWVECDGRLLNRTSCAALFSVIGTTWGEGNGTTSFNAPDASGRTPFGRDSGKGRLTGAGGLGGNVGDKGGSEAVTLSEAQMPSHGHGGSTGGAGAHDHGGVTAQAGQHSHGGATAASGAHTHAASSDAQGSHTHTGTTDNNGEHSHQQGYAVGVAGSGSTNRTVSDLSPTGSRTGIGVTDNGGIHQHTFTTASAGSHAHGIAVNGVGDHTHPIASDGNHTHTIPGVSDHSHTLSIQAAGGGQAHPNMPPGFVGIFAIKA